VTSAANTSQPGRPPRETTILALVVAACCVALGWAGRTTINPDGVAYLDIARRIAEGDWAAAVQGYWSPLYPALLAIVDWLSGASGADRLAWVHATNTLIALAGVAAVWHLARQHGSASGGRALLAGWMVASARAPRLDAITPDLLLLAIITMLGAELLRDGGPRGTRLGIWMGLAFLAKTSSWPWLLLLVGALLVVPAIVARRRVVVAAGVALLVSAPWLVPLSLEAGRPTVGSSGRLNTCWYLEQCEASRSPDTHLGNHERYGILPVTDSARVVIADLRGTPWTYAPWSDPEAWDRGIRTRDRVPITASDLLHYWTAQTGFVLGFWMPHLALGVLLPIVIAWGARRRWREGWARSRMPALLLVLGAAGVGQFIAVHAEPRLIAPYLFLGTMGLVWWLVPRTDESLAARVAPRWVTILGWLGIATAVPRAAWQVHTLTQRAAADHMRWSALMARVDRGVAGGRASFVGQPLVVIGPAFPVVAEAWLFQMPIVAQIPPSSAEMVRRWDPADQVALVERLRATGAGHAWLTRPDGSFDMAPIPR
jgi:hypothetical protein